MTKSTTSEHPHRNGLIRLFDELGSTPACSRVNRFRAPILAKVQGIFSECGLGTPLRDRARDQSVLQGQAVEIGLSGKRIERVADLASERFYALGGYFVLLPLDLDDKIGGHPAGARID